MPTNQQGSNAELPKRGIHRPDNIVTDVAVEGVLPQDVRMAKHIGLTGSTPTQLANTRRNGIPRR